MKFPRELVRSANATARIQEHYCNGDATEQQANAAIDRFEKKAKALGFSVDWPGLYPVLYKDGQEIYMS